MASLDEKYPQSCPFCRISQAYSAHPTSAVPSNPDSELVSPQCHLILSTPHVMAFLDIMPIAPGHILLTTRSHFAKLSDIPSSTRQNSDSTWERRREIEHARESARAVGEYLPIISRALCEVTGIEDWNIVQNNGVRAAQVVGHIHFHFIPRYQEGRLEQPKPWGGDGSIGDRANVDAALFKSWKMFGKGTREDLDDEEGAALAKALRDALRRELGEEEERLDARAKL